MDCESMPCFVGVFGAGHGREPFPLGSGSVDGQVRHFSS